MTQAAVLASNASLMTTPSGTAPGYMARAWVNFNGAGTVAIRASGNVSSITDNGAGDYTVNFTTAMPDANYSVVGYASLDSRTEPLTVNGYTTATQVAASVRINTRYVNSIATNGTNADMAIVNISIFR